MNRFRPAFEELGERALPAPLTFSYSPDLPVIDPIGLGAPAAAPAVFATVNLEPLWFENKIKGTEGVRAGGQLVVRFDVTVTTNGTPVVHQLTASGFAPPGQTFDPQTYVGQWVAGLTAIGFTVEGTPAATSTGLTIGKTHSLGGTVTNVAVTVVFATDEQGAVIANLTPFAPVVTPAP
jgi:hypothetical protein